MDKNRIFGKLFKEKEPVKMTGEEIVLEFSEENQKETESGSHKQRESLQRKIKGHGRR